ncbi:MAG: glycosyltransferase family 2 protein [Acidobacteria bacterium]|nr:glycosyltransferase family 2 protein [Acidobacteriota bacterium]
MTSPYLSVVIPLRDERENLQPLWKELKGILSRTRNSFEVVFVDDGSTDGSREVLVDIVQQDPRVRALHLLEPSGQSAALDAGFKAVRGDLIITMDADLQTDPVDILMMLDSLGTLDALVGYRVRRCDSLSRRLVSRVANSIRNRVLGEAIRDAGCSLKVFRRPCLERLRLQDGMHRFLPALLELEGFRIGQVGVGHRRRRWGRSKYGPTSRLLRPVVDLLVVRWMQRRRLRYRIREESALMGRGRSSRVG